MSMTARQIVVDTETTGVEVAQGHRVIEIGCVEMVARRLTGNTFHHYLNPKRDIDEAAAEVHGITAEQLADKPEFAEVARELLEFIKGAELIIHNAPFDVGFLNNEFKLAGIAVGDGDGDDGAGDGDAGGGKSKGGGDGGSGKNQTGGVIEAHCEVTDTLAMAREQFPGQRNSLDALCDRFAVDRRQRDLHGARLDAELLADVYLAMTGGQVTLLGDAADSPDHITWPAEVAPPANAARLPTPLIPATETDLQAHQQWLKLLEKESKTGAVWKTVAEDARDSGNAVDSSN